MLKIKPKKVLVIVVLLGLSIIVFPSITRQNGMDYTYNPLLETVNTNPDWQGTPIDASGRFVNLHEPFESDLTDLIRWRLSSNPFREQKEQDTRRLEVVMNNEMFDSTDDKIVWLGHASFFIQIGGIRILTDPVFLPNMFLERFSDLPFHPDSIRNIDYVLLSHNHRDHIDKSTLEFLYEKMPDIEILTGLNMASLLQRWMPDVAVQEAGWYQKYTLDENGPEIIFTPARHWTRRGMFDENLRLWGGFFIRYHDTTIYFMGDSGYTRHFAEIREVLGDVDYALMGVGAFEPQWFMEPVHISPLDAIKGFRELGGKYFIPMHYGTFDLSDEPLLHPLDVLKSEDLPELVALKVGEELLIEGERISNSIAK